MSRISLPIYILARPVDYNESTDDLVIPTRQTPGISIVVKSVPSFPIFTNIDTAQRVIELSGRKLVPVACDKRRIIAVLDSIRPPLVNIDPSGVPQTPQNLRRIGDFLQLLVDDPTAAS